VRGSYYDWAAGRSRTELQRQALVARDQKGVFLRVTAGEEGRRNVAALRNRGQRGWCLRLYMTPFLLREERERVKECTQEKTLARGGKKSLQPALTFGAGKGGAVCLRHGPKRRLLWKKKVDPMRPLVKGGRRTLPIYGNGTTEKGRKGVPQLAEKGLFYHSKGGEKWLRTSFKWTSATLGTNVVNKYGSEGKGVVTDNRNAERGERKSKNMEREKAGGEENAFIAWQGKDRCSRNKCRGSPEKTHGCALEERALSFGRERIRGKTSYKKLGGTGL